MTPTKDYNITHFILKRNPQYFVVFITVKKFNEISIFCNKIMLSFELVIGFPLIGFYQFVNNKITKSTQLIAIPFYY